jgi:hypothetical protein
MAKILYTQAGSDAASIKWPPGTSQAWIFATGTPVVIPELIFYPANGMITYADGREFPRISPQGSTFVGQKG